MKILLDAMGGDNAPIATIKGAIKASKEIDSEIILIGNEEIINSKIKEFYGKNLSEITNKITIKSLISINITSIISLILSISFNLDTISPVVCER